MPLTIDASRPWRLSHVLEGHSSDVKSVYASVADEETELLHSASRDETARSWYRFKDDLNAFQRGASYQGHRYQNAVVHVAKREEKGSGLAILGGLDAQIRTFESKSSFSEKPQSKVVQVLSDHYNNVCHLSVYEGRSEDLPEQTLLISGSWDCTSRVWALNQEDQKWHNLHTLKGHEGAVWAAEVVSAKEGRERYLTASADLFVRLWHGEELKRVFAGHSDVVRAIALLPAIPSHATTSPLITLPSYFDQEALFVTASNDGTLRVWSLDERRCPKGNPASGGDPLRVLQSEQSSDLLYDVKYAGFLDDGKARLVISCGEGGFVRGWNVEDGSLIMSIPQPVTSVWSLALMPLSGDLVTANSDAVVRVFTQRPDARTNEEYGGGLIPQVTLDQLREHEDKCQQIASKQVRSIEARTVAKEAGATTLRGIQYDQILQIDVSDDAEPLSLGWNRGGDPRAAAKEFISRHKLPETYEDQLVTFIEQVGV